MAHRHALRLSLGGLAAAGCLTAALLALARDHGPSYTVSQVQAGLAHDPRAWTNRTLRLRGVATAVGCWVTAAGLGEDGMKRTDWCPPPRFVLGDADPTAVAALPLAWTSPDPLLAIGRRVPPLSALLPAPQAVDWGEAAVYRVRVLAQTQTYCGARVCYEALLLDAAPGALGEG
jgi:hypothetical protein